MVDFGERLKNLRTKKKLTQSQLATKLGLSKSEISAYENGIRLPSYDILISLTFIFQVSTDYLLGVKNKNLIDLSGLTEEEKKSIINLIEVMKH